MSLEEIQEEIERYYINMENELLQNIANKLAIGLPMEIDKWDEVNHQPLEGSGGVNEWQLERLKELGGLTEENAKIIAKYSGKTIEDVEKVFDRACEIGTEVDKEQIKLGIKAGILNEVNPVIEKAIVKEIYRNAVNSTLTTFNEVNNSLLASAGVEYKKIVNNVSAEVMAGTKTIGKAMQESVTKLADKGLTGFVARNGSQWTPEAYVKMVLRTNTRQTTNKVQEERIKQSGGNYYEISQHMGARPLCSEDQGKIFSIDGDTTPIKDGLGHSIKVYDWSKSSYGKPAGILGINCGHSRYMFVPGLSIHREKKIDKAENDEAYQEKQQQRLYERTIRNKKREIQMLKTTGANQDYIKLKQTQLTNYSKQYLNFLDKTGRTRITANEWIGSNISTNKVNKINSKPKISSKSREKKYELSKDEKYAINKYIGFDSYTYNEKLRNNIDLTKEEEKILNNLDSALSKMPKYEGNVTRSVSVSSNDIDYFLKNYKVGSIVKHKAYTSTTKGDIYNPDARVQMNIVSKNGRDITKYNKEEQEILFIRNSKFKVKKVDTNDDFYVRIELEEIE